MPYRMVARIAKAAGIPRHISPHSLRRAAITNDLDAGVPLRDARILARDADPRTTEHDDRARGKLDRHRVHFLTVYVAGVCGPRPTLTGESSGVLGVLGRTLEGSLLAGSQRRPTTVHESLAARAAATASRNCLSAAFRTRLVSS